MTCLHALEGEAAARLSLPVIRGVSQTSLEGALALVEQGDATREDFWVFVGCAGWAPKQLEAEVDDGTWLMASADSATLLRELLSQGTALQPPADEDATAVEAPHGAFGDGGGAVAADGLATWSELMRSIGRGADVETSRGCLADNMLGEWVRHRLYSRTGAPRWGWASGRGDEGIFVEDTEGAEGAEGTRETEATIEATTEATEATTEATETTEAAEYGDSLVGAVLCAGAVPAPRFLLNEQYLLQSVLLVVEEVSEGFLAVALNRPTATIAFLDHGEVERRLLSFGGDCQLVDGSGVEMQSALDANGILWLHHRPELGGEEVGRSGVWRTWASRAAEQVRRGDASLSDFLLVSGLVPFEADELPALLASGEMRRVEQPQRIWPQLWALADAADADAEPGRGWRARTRPSSGAGLWRAAAQQPGGGGEAAVGTQLADAALALWHERLMSEGEDEAPAEDEALDDGADEYDYGSDEDFPGATG